MISFVAEESVEKQIVAALRLKHEVLYIAEEKAGIKDEKVLDLCVKKKAVLITADKDFGELVFRFRKSHFGVILNRFSGIDNQDKVSTFIRAIDAYADEIKGNFTVISKDGIRIRKPFEK